MNFLLFPLHTAVFPPEEYGVFTYLMSFVAALNVIYSFGMETAYFRFANDPSTDEAHVFRVAQTVVVAISVGCSLIFFAFADSIAVALNVGGHEEYIVWLTVILLVDNIVVIPFARLRKQRRPLLFAAFRISNVVVLTGLNYFFLKIAYDPAVGIGYVFLANLIANVLYIFFFFRTLVAWRPAYDAAITPTMVNYAYPIMLTGLAGMTNEFYSRVALKWWLPPDFYPGKSTQHAVGVFGACYKFAVFMSLTVQAFRLAAEPFFFSNASDKNSPTLFARVNHYFVIVGCFVMLAISINVDILKHWFLRQPEYWEGIEVIPLLLLGYLLLGIYYNFSVWFKLIDKTYVGTVITLGGAVLTVFLNYLLIPQFGYVGSSWATVIVFAVMALVCYLLGQRFYPIPYHLSSMLGYVLGTFLLIYLVDMVSFSHQWQSTAFHFSVPIAFGGLVLALEQKQWRRVK